MKCPAKPSFFNGRNYEGINAKAQRREDAKGNKDLLIFGCQEFYARKLSGSARRAPKVTVTRQGDSLCQKGCYPLALVFC